MRVEWSPPTVPCWQKGPSRASAARDSFGPGGRVRGHASMGICACTSTGGEQARFHRESPWRDDPPAPHDARGRSPFAWAIRAAPDGSFSDPLRNQTMPGLVFARRCSPRSSCRRSPTGFTWQTESRRTSLGWSWRGRWRSTRPSWGSARTPSTVGHCRNRAPSRKSKALLCRAARTSWIDGAAATRGSCSDISTPAAS